MVSGRHGPFHVLISFLQPASPHHAAVDARYMVGELVLDRDVEDIEDPGGCDPRCC